MTSRKNVQNTHIDDAFRILHGAIVDMTVLMNRPQMDESMIAAAGISLDRALFPLLLGIGRFGPIGVVDLADRAGRDYTTVSRQVAKLESLGLVSRAGSAADRRVREATITPKGQAMTDQVDSARLAKAHAIFAGWDRADLDDLARLMRRFADDLNRAAGEVPPDRPT
jgi:DNA-binding MarR family transcriptional regulator